MSITQLFTLVTMVYLSKFSQVNSQFPSECITKSNLENKTCCPNDCNANSGKGYCSDILVVEDDTITWPNYQFDYENEEDGDLDRHSWPTKFFERQCKCNHPYFGFDCSSCSFGYRGDDCSEKYVITRKNATDLTPFEKDRFRYALNKAKLTKSRYKVTISFRNDIDLDNLDQHFKEVTVFDFHAWIHYYAARNNVAEDGELDEDNFLNDFAHESPAFLPWHRAWLLLLEKDLQELIKDEEFAIPYWDWTADEHYNSDCTNSVCKDDLVGSMDKNNNLVGSFSEWRSICLNYTENHKLGKLCDVSVDNDVIITREKNPKGGFPKSEEVEFALSVGHYDIQPNMWPDDMLNTARNVTFKNTWRESDCTFRNILEGFSYSSNNAKRGHHDENSHEIHNMVHISLMPIMNDNRIAANEPIFSLHHANIDRYFEKWLRRYGDTGYYPGGEMNFSMDSSEIPVGHRMFSNMVPFFPTIIPLNVSVRSENFGYTYYGMADDGLEENENEWKTFDWNCSDILTKSDVVENGVTLKFDWLTYLGGVFLIYFI